MNTAKSPADAGEWRRQRAWQLRQQGWWQKGIAAAADAQAPCKVYAPQIASANPDGYWYRIASSPWSNSYYAVANTFMSGDPWNGPSTQHRFQRSQLLSDRPAAH